MNFDIIDLIVIAYVMAPLAIIIFAVGVWVGRLKEKTIAQAAMINAMRSGDELTEDDHKEIANLEAQRNICLAAAKEAQREAELARKVADAAVAWAEWDWKESLLIMHGCDAPEEFDQWSEQSQPFYDALREAVREYRARREGVEGS